MFKNLVNRRVARGDRAPKVAAPRRQPLKLEGPFHGSANHGGLATLAPPPPTVRYDGGTIPASLRRYLDAHAHQVAAASHEGGYCTGHNGVAYDILMRPGWKVYFYGDRMHTIIVASVKEAIDVLRTAEPCGCEGECAEALPAVRLGLRQRRDSLLLNDRATKNTAAWKRAYRETTAALNAVAKELREQRREATDHKEVR
jgi:hypothetical protein